MSARTRDDVVKEIIVTKDTVHVDVWYPRTPTNQKYVCVGLMDVRSSDDIRISYDFGRDGWIIEQASVFHWSADDTVCDPKWKEVAFIQAWSLLDEPDDVNG
jgi:hypothetical protein